ncbi:hypothetical protein BUALT_Bualt05G0116500 [Buddleja alternifolia]|uniref:DUF4216 domain-containing protein n=1 Tax=Buddleja alternifolia TaxID=168488 RepID=A0AAV6XIF5_9LAMI|nr:hypothetical protein BUALT_Bualt05G0116500 [Buddleja alternifolia]
MEMILSYFMQTTKSLASICDEVEQIHSRFLWGETNKIQRLHLVSWDKVCQSPESPGRSLDVYFQPLIDELKTLWDVGVETYDVSKKQNFQMKAALMWTINDFPAYGILLSWNTLDILYILYDAKKQAQLLDLTPHALALIRDKVENPANQITDNDIKRLSRGFNSIVKCWNGHIMNGYRFHTFKYREGKSTMNSGVCISGSYYNDSTIEYYGELLEILELRFLGPGDNTVVMFKCKWFDSGRLGTKVHPSHTIGERKHLITTGGAIFRVKARNMYEISYTSMPSEQTPLEEFYQETSSSNLTQVVLDNEFDDIDIVINVHLEEEVVNADELHLHERELEQEVEFDDLEERLVESDEENSLEKELGDEDNLVYSDSSSG